MNRPRLRRHHFVLVFTLALSFVIAGSPASTDAVTVVDSAPSHAVAGVVTRTSFGAFVEGMQTDPSVLQDFEQLVGTRTDIASYYYGFGDVFPGPLERTFADHGSRKVLLSWDMGPTRFRQWTTGRYDAYLTRIAAAARAYPYPLYVRPWPEMNGDWQAFQPTAAGKRRYGGTYAEFKAAWRHVVSYTRRLGASNIRWVFNPSSDTYATTTPVEKIWPGARYVNILGIDGFNWGQDTGWGRWKSFPKIFKPMYRRLTKLHRTAPVWICEFGSKEPEVDDGAPVDTTHDKARWLAHALSYDALPRVEAKIYFQADKERDWRVNSSTGALSAVLAALARPLTAIFSSAPGGRARTSVSRSRTEASTW